MKQGESGQVERLLTVDEAAERLGTSTRFIRRLIAERRIAYTKLGRHVRIAEHDLVEPRHAPRTHAAGAGIEPVIREQMKNATTYIIAAIDASRGLSESASTSWIVLSSGSGVLSSCAAAAPCLPTTWGSARRCKSSLIFPSRKRRNASSALPW